MTASGVRARVRAELTKEIADVARRHLAESGAVGLSLRAVARELGMASSAVYRYFPSRDDLLTTLIIDAYDALGAAAETADARRRAGAHGPLARRLHRRPRLGAGQPARVGARLRLPRARLRRAADHDRIGGPGCRLVLVGVLRDGLADGTVTDPGEGTDTVLRAGLSADLGLPDGADASLGSRAVLVWSSLVGSITFEVFGQFTNTVEDRDRLLRASPPTASRRLVGLA